MHRKAGLVIALLLAMAACGGDDDEPQAAATPAPTVPATTEAHATSLAPTTVATSPPTTDTVPTTSPTTAPPPTTTEAPAPSGWTDSHFVPAASLQGYSGNWWGESGPSPAAPAAGDLPADGYYFATVLQPWSPEQPDHLSVRIQRLEWCTTLPDGCEYMDDAAEEMNLDPSWQLDVDVPLDATTNVVVQGYRCWNALEQKQATGVELLDLFQAYTADYQSLIAPRLGSPTAGWDVAQEIAAAPAGGFVGEQDMCPDDYSGPLRYVYEDAPVLLLQTVTDGDAGELDATEFVHLDGVQYTDGAPLFYFYAGFYS